MKNLWSGFFISFSSYFGYITYTYFMLMSFNEVLSMPTMVQFVIMFYVYENKQKYDSSEI